jgi:hypothetical protein
MGIVSLKATGRTVALSVMPGLVPGIHVFSRFNTVKSKDVDGRDKPGHDG